MLILITTLILIMNKAQLAFLISNLNTFFIGLLIFNSTLLIVNKIL